MTSSQQNNKDNRYGIQVSSVRADILDAEAIAQVKLLASETLPVRRPLVLDLGCGAGVQSARMACAGGLVYAIDVVDYRSHVISAAVAAGQPWHVRFKQVDARHLNNSSTLEAMPFDMVYCQRMLHYLRYGEALGVLTYLHRKIVPLGTLFLGLSGMASELAIGYGHALRPVFERFGMLGQATRASHKILEQLCLYTLEEAAELVESAGFRVMRIWLSDFGNVKLVARAGDTREIAL